MVSNTNVNTALNSAGSTIRTKCQNTITGASTLFDALKAFWRATRRPQRRIADAVNIQGIPHQHNRPEITKVRVGRYTPRKLSTQAAKVEHPYTPRKLSTQ